MKQSVLAACAVCAPFLPLSAFAQAQGGGDTVVVEGDPGGAVDAALDRPGPSAGGTAAAGGESVLSYIPDYFAPYNPNTAADMVTRVPGFNINSGGNARGFGQNASNVLIDGARPSAISQNIFGILASIPAGDVVRIDLIRGQAAGVDMGGHPVVVNVIRRVSDRGGGTWRLQGMYNSATGDTGAEGEANRNFTLWGANVAAGFVFEGQRNGRSAREAIFAPGGAPLQTARQRFEGGPKGWSATLNADRRIGEWTARLNARYDDGGFFDNSYWARTGGLQIPPGADAYPFSFLRNDFEQNTFESDSTGWELGGDLERALADNLTLKIIGVTNREEETDRSTFSTFSDIAGPVRAFTNESEDESGESILRSFVAWTPRPNLSMEIGAEGAFNFLESSNAATGGGVSATRVEEYRTEPYVSALWRVHPRLGFDAAFQTEFSEISQSGFADRTRSFTYPKGHLTATWDPRANTQIRVTADRSVGQLNFNDFQRSINFQENLNFAGNPDLVPQQVWALSGVFEQRFWDDGVFSIELARDWITDAQGQTILVSATPGVLTEGPGNLGDATRWSFEITLDVPLDRLGVPDARLTIDYEYGDSELTDPLTGRPREYWNSGCFFCDGERELSIEFRKDHPAAGISWGFEFEQSDGGEAYRLNEINVNANNRGGGEVWIETTRIEGLTVRLSAYSLGNFYSDRIRWRFAGPRDAAPLAVTEIRRMKEEPFIQLQVTGRF